jgi:hypothetical protein
MRAKAPLLVLAALCAGAALPSAQAACQIDVPLDSSSRLGVGGVFTFSGSAVPWPIWGWNKSPVVTSVRVTFPCERPAPAGSGRHLAGPVGRRRPPPDGRRPCSMYRGLPSHAVVPCPPPQPCAAARPSQCHTQRWPGGANCRLLDSPHPLLDTPSPAILTLPRLAGSGSCNFTSSTIISSANPDWVAAAAGAQLSTPAPRE